MIDNEFQSKFKKQFLQHFSPFFAFQLMKSVWIRVVEQNETQQNKQQWTKESLKDK